MFSNQDGFNLNIKGPNEKPIILTYKDKTYYVYVKINFLHILSNISCFYEDIEAKNLLFTIDGDIRDEYNSKEWLIEEMEKGLVVMEKNMKFKKRREEIASGEFF